MVKVYYEVILTGYKSIDQLPLRRRAGTQALLDAITSSHRVGGALTLFWESVRVNLTIVTELIAVRHTRLGQPRAVVEAKAGNDVIKDAVLRAVRRFSFNPNWKTRQAVHAWSAN